MLIIAIILLGLNGCGYKAPPFYTEDAPKDVYKSDDNIEFKVKNPDIKKISPSECDKEK